MWELFEINIVPVQAYSGFLELHFGLVWFCSIFLKSTGLIFIFTFHTLQCFAIIHGHSDMHTWGDDDCEIGIKKKLIRSV